MEKEKFKSIGKTEKDSKVYIVDTNIILNDTNNLKLLSDNGKNIIVVPEIVLIELEEFKKDTSELGFLAREFIRIISTSKQIKTLIKPIKSSNPLDEQKSISIVKFKTLDGVDLHIFAKSHYDATSNIQYIKEINDKRIIEIAEEAKEYYKGRKCIFVSLDGYARIFSMLSNISNETLHKGKTEKKEYIFLKNITLKAEVFDKLYPQPIIQLDPTYCLENFAYKFINEDEPENFKYAIVSGGVISILDDKDFEGMFVKPINIKQKLFVKSILENSYDLHIIDARAGSGKTLMALASAMKLMKLNTTYNKIVYVRNSIESLQKGEDVGYLSGNDEKFRIYNMALYDNLEFIATKLLDKKGKKSQKDKPATEEDLLSPIKPADPLQDKVKELIAKFNIQRLWPGEARGRTISNAIVILDEWQNASDKTTQLILSRFDNSCKAIVIGSNRQIDNIYVNKLNNGLTDLLTIATSKEDNILKCFCIDMETSVRGKFAQFADDVF